MRLMDSIAEQVAFLREDGAYREEKIDVLNRLLSGAGADSSHGDRFEDLSTGQRLLSEEPHADVVSIDVQAW